MISERRVTLEVDGGVAILRLARPEARNGIDPAMVDALSGAVVACEADTRVRALLIAGDGPAFSVGGDLRHLTGRLDHLPEELDTLIAPYHDTLGRLAALPVPVVCAVRGAAAGGALGLLWCADLVLAADDLRLASGFARIGLSGDGGSTWHLPRLVGLRRALDFSVGGRVLTAAEALEWGMVSRVVPTDRLEAEALAEVRRLAAGATTAYAHIRRLLRTSGSRTFEEQLEAEREAIVDCGRTADAVEGIAAFCEHRDPRFEGRRSHPADSAPDHREVCGGDSPRSVAGMASQCPHLPPSGPPR